MGGRFCFFTDPALLDAQSAAQAFGPQPAASGNDFFRVTDLHSLTAAAPAFAICDGLLCAQEDDHGTLTLILKVTAQPPFDFPAIAYVLYKGVDPASLFVSGNSGANGVIDISQAADNRLVDILKKSWAANGNAGDPARECLGLHLSPSSVASQYPHLVLGKYTDTESLARLFYQGDPKIQLPKVAGGAKIGSFAAAAGLEIVMEHIGYEPRIGLARARENAIVVPSLNPSASHATDDASYFLHWHAKEECLNFLDPCALWGSFFTARLRVWSSADAKFEAKTGDKIYEDILRAGFDDAGPTSGAFFNRNRAYLDIRNEHDKSFNYYKTNGDTILATFDPAASIDTQPQTYGAEGWPIFRTDQSMLPASQSGPSATLRLAFIAGNYRRLVLYGSPSRGNRKKTGPRVRSSFFLPDLTAPPEFGFAVPLYGSGPGRGVSRHIAVTVCIHDKKPDDEIDGALELFPWEPPGGIPYDPRAIAFERPGSAAVRTFAEPCLVRMPFDWTEPVPMRIGWIRAGMQAALVATPATLGAGDIATRLPPFSAIYAGAGLFEATNEMIKPYICVYREAVGGGRYLDYTTPPGWTNPLPRSGGGRFVYFMSAQTMSDIEQAAGPDALAVAIAAMPTGDLASPIMMCANGLRTQDGRVVPFSVPVDTGGLSNAGIH